MLLGQSQLNSEVYRALADIYLRYQEDGVILTVDDLNEAYVWFIDAWFTDDEDEESTKVFSKLDTYIDPRSKVSGWKVKVLDVEPDRFGGNTRATVELFDPDGNSQGEDIIYVHRKAIKIGKTYDACIDGITASPKIKGVEDIPYSEVPDMRKATKDLYY